MTREKIRTTIALWQSYLYPLKQRPAFIGDGGVLCFWSIHDESWSKEVDADDVWNKQNTPRRELVWKIKRAKDPLLAENGHIRILEKVILFYAGSPEKRRALKTLQERYAGIINQIGNEDIKFEPEAENFYNDFKLLLKPTKQVLDSIAALSWYDDPNYSTREYLCYAWIIVTCIIWMINLEKE